MTALPGSDPQEVACAGMSLHAWFTNDEVAVEPGSTLVIPLRIQNLDDSDETVAIIPAGPASSWMTMPAHELVIPAGEVRGIDLEVTPPELPTTNAGPTTVAVRVIPQDERLDLPVETTIDVLPFDHRRVVALQPVLRSRRRATYEFMVENEGNNMASCRLRLVDVTNRIDGSFDPPAVGVPPGESSLVQLRARTVRRRFRRSTRTLEFEVEAEQQGHAPARSTFALVQPPTIPMRLLGRLFLILALLGAAAGAWFWVVQPEIQDAAADEVDRLAAELALAAEEAALTTVTEEQPEPPTAEEEPVEEPAEEAPEGEPDFVRLKVEPGLTQTEDASFTVPAGEIFDLTDVRVENPFNDSGVASLLVNGEEVFLWSLQNIRGSQFEPSITQKRLIGGDNVTFSVRCDAISDPFRSTCTNAVNVGGLVYRP